MRLYSATTIAFFIVLLKDVWLFPGIPSLGGGASKATPPKKPEPVQQVMIFNGSAPRYVNGASLPPPPPNPYYYNSPYANMPASSYPPVQAHQTPPNPPIPAFSPFRPFGPPTPPQPKMVRTKWWLGWREQRQRKRKKRQKNPYNGMFYIRPRHWEREEDGSGSSDKESE